MTTKYFTDINPALRQRSSLTMTALQHSRCLTTKRQKDIRTTQVPTTHGIGSATDKEA